MLKTIPWKRVYIKVVGIETAGFNHAVSEFNGTKGDIDDLMTHHGYSNYGDAGYDTFYLK